MFFSKRAGEPAAWRTFVAHPGVVAVLLGGMREAVGLAGRPSVPGLVSVTAAVPAAYRAKQEPEGA